MNKEISGSMPFSPDSESFKSKRFNLERMIPIELLPDLTYYELRIIMLINIQKGQRTKLTMENIEYNQTFELSLKKNPKLFPNQKSYYTAINNLIDRKLLKKVDGKQSVYMVNPNYISNLTMEQSSLLQNSKLKSR